MKALKKVIAIVLVLCTVLCTVACGGSSSSDNDLVIAYIGPLTGEAAAWGTPEANTLKMLVEEANANGGIAGKNGC